jgi:hypothetical protein
LAERISTAALPIGSESEDYRGNKIFVFTLETPTVLSRSLSQLTLGTLRNLPKPNQADCVSVCSEFFFFAIGGHHDTLYQDKKRRTGAVRIIAELAPSEPALPRSRYVRKPVGGRAKQDIISHFIIHAARGGLRLPNLSKTVLPYRSVMSTHSAYVRLEETRLDSAAIALAAHYRNATAEDVARAQGELTCAQCLAVFISRIAGEEAAVVNADQPVALVSKQASRYYNRLCGPIGIIPLHDEVAVLQYFRKVWVEAAELKMYIVRKWIPFAKCEVCKAFKLAENKERDPELRLRIQKHYDRHLADIELERRCFYSNRIRATLEPDMYLSLIMDGADQKFNQLPHYCERSHATDGEDLQKVYVHGCLAHGREGYVFTFPPHVKQGHNITCEMLWRVLVDVLKKEGKIPPILHLQLDNTTKTNKGRTLFAFLYLLVHFGVLMKVVVTFLPVGHTHEDIDQLFSRTAEFMRRTDALTRLELEDAIRRSCLYNKKPLVLVPLQTAANLSAWFKNMKLPSVEGCMSYRHFRFKKDKNGVTLLQVRSSPIVSYTSEPWQGLAPNKNYHAMFADKPTPNLYEVMASHTLPFSSLVLIILTLCIIYRPW